MNDEEEEKLDLILKEIKDKWYQRGISGYQEGIKLARIETAERILEMWYEPWPVTRKPFIDNLKAYIEELKK